MAQSDKECVVVDDEIEINLTEDQLKYIRERKRLGRHSCDPNVTIADPDCNNTVLKKRPSDVDDSTASEIFDDSSLSSGETKDGDEREPPKNISIVLTSPTLIEHSLGATKEESHCSKSIAAEQKNEEEVINKRLNKRVHILDITASEDDALSVETGPADPNTAFFDVSDSMQLIDSPRKSTSSIINGASPTHTRCFEATEKHISDDGNLLLLDSGDREENSDLIPVMKDLVDERLKLPSHLDQLSSNMGRAVLSAQRKQLFQKSFQNCNYLDVGKLRSPNTKKVQSVLRNYINTKSPGTQRVMKKPPTPTGSEITEQQHQHQSDNYSVTPPHSGIGRSPCAVVYQSARLFGRPLATPRLLASPAPLITIHHRSSPSAARRNLNEPQLRINESIYETFEAKMTPRK
ncbi:uncharacterized protein LOC111252868 [Varroa destructor]|uniref:Uncharacterized protein n=1 Tax=Varroa destructor TaxID=109461 RepID=A0A7M7KHV9_VARDE|nr:uncharacterized protein LOC111252868 [Varroa destructor]